MSLDGYIAREDGNLDWLDEASAKVPAGEDCGYYSFFEPIDTMATGRHTFEEVLSFGDWSHGDCSYGDWPYGEKRVVVLSSGDVAIPDELNASVTSSSESPDALCQRMESEGCQHVYLDGGLTIQRFLKEGRVDDMTIAVIPMLPGSGIPLFGAVDTGDIRLENLK